MPGNKNSGRKKKVVIAEGEEVTHDTVVDEVKNRGGRPRKKDSISTVVEKNTRETTKELIDNNVRKKQHVVDLGKRSSAINKFYDECLGPPLEKFPPSKLPLVRVVLQRYRFLRTKCHSESRSSLVGVISNELIFLWENSSIPHDKYRAVCKLVDREVMKWLNATEDERKSDVFDTGLNKLLDIRPISLQNLPALENHLKTSGNSKWREDYDFFIGQCEFPQRTKTSSSVDKIHEKKVKVKASRQEKQRVFAEKNAGEFSAPTNSSSQSSSSMSDCNNVEFFTQLRPRKSAVTAKQQITKVVTTSGGETSDEDDGDRDWDLPVREKRRQRQRPNTITLTLPAKDIPSVLAKTSVVTKTSLRHELKIVSTLIKEGGANIEEAVISVSTVQRRRRSEVSATAHEIQEKIKRYFFNELQNLFNIKQILTIVNIPG